jgi:hypothetical protein
MQMKGWHHPCTQQTEINWISGISVYLPCRKTLQSTGSGHTHIVSASSLKKPIQLITFSCFTVKFHVSLIFSRWKHCCRNEGRREIKPLLITTETTRIVCCRLSCRWKNVKCSHLGLHVLPKTHCRIQRTLRMLCSGAVGWGTALQAGRSRVRFPIMSLIFFMTSFRPHYGPGVDAACNTNEYQEYFLWVKGGRCVGLTLPPSCADVHEIWEPQTPGTFRACNGIALHFTDVVPTNT